MELSSLVKFLMADQINKMSNRSVHWIRRSGSLWD